MEIEYVAGLLDGEGSFSISRGKKWVHPSIKISMIKTPQTVALLKEVQTFFNAGHIFHAPKEYWTKHGLNAHDQISWTIQAKGEAIIVCERILPYLKLKRKDCETVLSYCKEKA